jgi:hypothetical protein
MSSLALETLAIDAVAEFSSWDVAAADLELIEDYS